MSERRKGLGRGLGALIPTGPSTPSPGAGVATMERSRPVDVFFSGGQARTSTLADPVETTSELPPNDAATPDTPTTEVVQPLGAEESEATVAATETRSSAQAASEDSAIPDTPPGDTPPGDTPPGAIPGVETTPADPGAPSAEAVPQPEPDEELLGIPGLEFREIPLDQIVPNPRQPRQVFDEDELAELVISIREIGVLQPIVVRPAGEKFELVMGERRWRACQQAGLELVPAIIRATPDTDLLRDALLENLHRSQLNPLEEAAAYDQLLKDFGCSHEELAGRIGRSRPQISNTIRLLNLPPLVQRRVAAGVLSAGHARALLGLLDAGAMERLAQRIVAEGLSVRATEEIVALGGDEDSPRRRTIRQRPQNERLDRLATNLSDRLETRVKIAMGARRGRLTVEFAGVEDLERIMALLAPDHA